MKCVERVIDGVKGEGLAAREPILQWLSLGLELREFIVAKCNEILEICEEWKTLLCSTDIDDLGNELENEKHRKYKVIILNMTFSYLDIPGANHSLAKFR